MHTTTPVIVTFPPLYKPPKEIPVSPTQTNQRITRTHTPLLVRATQRGEEAEREGMAAPRLATLALAVLLAAAVASPPAAVRAAMSCTTVYNTLMPCLPFVQMGGAMPPQPCCSGIRSLLREANNTPDRRTVCGCLKNVASSAAGSSTYIDRAAALPGKCGVNLPYKISNRVDCNTIN